MSLDQDFERIVGWFARLNGGVDEMRNDQASAEAALASAEYELDQMRQDIAAVKLAPLTLNKVA
jgi:hypothetical protein